MTTPLAVPSDLQAIVPSLTDGAAQSAIDRASAMIRAIAGQSFDFTQGDQVVLAGGGRDLVLPQRPIVVDSQNPLLVEESFSQQSSWFANVEGQGFDRIGSVLRKRWASMVQPAQWFPQSFPWVQAYPVGVWAPAVRVTYSHGFQTVPDALKALVIDSALVLATNPESLYSDETVVGGITRQKTWQRASVVGKADLLDQIKAKLTLLGLRQGGAYSIGAS